LPEGELGEEFKSAVVGGKGLTSLQLGGNLVAINSCDNGNESTNTDNVENAGVHGGGNSLLLLSNHEIPNTTQYKPVEDENEDGVGVSLGDLRGHCS
jgi:hypothetical protein